MMRRQFQLLVPWIPPAVWLALGIFKRCETEFGLESLCRLPDVAGVLDRVQPTTLGN